MDGFLKLKERKFSEPGMTLIEVLVVISIIALLLILSFVVYQAQIAKGNDAKRKADVYKIKIALEEYEKDNECYPATLPSCGENLSSYLGSVPCDPVSKEPYAYFPEPGTSCPSWYWTFVNLDNVKEDTDSEELGCQYGCGPSEDLTVFEYYEYSPNAPKPFRVTEGGSIVDGVALTDYYGCFEGVCKFVGAGDEKWCFPNYGSLDVCLDRCDPGDTCTPY